ncbi:bifunctional phosphopantothenoylcysteine decarboxylase/phosphopantothenate--cysteine ligase CoaBC [Rhodoligotrophos defluvii]|uniref:bifunctional phosphopantothenoylcysteine decarboxylase/phosphopantothenate--cysteine ligase CoaBC n=1 Tax=Rhodoligotrophos defluvii TaxID=2561934 RepID=UPI0010CA00B5|nr:bifunctional phosphopantothenoylcysteine decarboxylase/phosphopantothenate--cysteine ligase CoaBC [Rhodoligotrophos defluvii]
MLRDKRILLIVGGGIAAYKDLILIRRLRERGASVQAILTKAAEQFVTPLSVASLSENKVYTDLFNLTDESEMGHIQLSRSADLLVVAPATADLIAKMAAGRADDLASTTVLATDTPVLIAPAMNVRMWEHPATKRNMATLRSDGVIVVGPEQGDMACGEYGYGRMAEPEAIVAAIEDFFAAAVHRPLAGFKVLVTAGPTHEPIDPVRYIANRSSGQQGYAIAAASQQLGADTVLVSGPTALDAPAGVTLRRVETAQQMLEACEAELPCDVGIFAAAVADWRVGNAADQKIKKRKGELPPLRLVENPDILKTIARLQNRRPRLVVGFAAETQDVITNATRKREAKGCDWIVANDVSPATGIMGGPNNTIHLVTGEGVEEWPNLPKAEVGRKLMERVAEAVRAAAR